MGRTPEKAKRKKYLVLSLVSNLGLLLTFKYLNFFLKSISHTLVFFQIDKNIPELSLLLPVGISFYTLQTLSYSIDVYRGNKEPEKHLGIFALYVSFFPQLVAGPIERSTRLLPQFHQKHPFDSERIVSGLQQILWGFLKKVVIADNLAALVNTVYNSPTQFNSTELLIGTYLFSFQIFCDFSGYSDIAIGVAKIMGYDLMENFRRPYFSRTIAQFWRRWHISLSTWFRDYIYIPLGGNQVPALRWYFNLFFVFLISGLWHGANWTFLIWGALHGLYFILSIELTPIREAITKFTQLERIPWLHEFIQIFTTFHLVTFAWIFFRANNLSEAFYIVRKIFTLSSLELPYFKHELLVPLMLILLMEIVHLSQRNGSIRERINQQPTWVRWAIYYAIIIFILFFGVFENQQFIYFQF